jgi:cytosolic iron-sulfur protein assembly protein CIAO1
MAAPASQSSPPVLRGRIAGTHGAVWDVAWCPVSVGGTRLLASCGADKSVRVWALAGLWGEQTTAGAGSTSAALGWKSDEDTDGALRWACVAVLEDVHQRTVRRLAWSPDGLALAASSFDGSVSVWRREAGWAEVSATDPSDDDRLESGYDLGTGDSTKAKGGFSCVATLEGHENEVKGVAWDSSGSLLATCGRDKTVWVWEGDEDYEFECLAVLHGHSQDVKRVLWHPTREILFSCSYDNSVKVWQDEDDDWFCTHTLNAHDSTVWDMAFDATGTRLVTVSDDKSVAVWNTEGALRPNDPTPQRVASLEGQHERCVFSTDWSGSGALEPPTSPATGKIATGCGDDGIRIIQRSEGGAEEYEVVGLKAQAHKADVNCVRWCPQPEADAPLVLASCSDDGDVAVWTLE